MNPIMLCMDCDSEVHSEDQGIHLRFDLPSKSFSRKGSIRSTNSDSGTEEDSDSNRL